MSVTIDCRQFYTAFCLAAENLKMHKDTLNQMNIFPVADKDTGINMARSLEKTVKNLVLSDTPAQVAENA